MCSCFSAAACLTVAVAEMSAYRVADVCMPHGGRPTCASSSAGEAGVRPSQQRRRCLQPTQLKVWSAWGARPAWAGPLTRSHRASVAPLHPFTASACAHSPTSK